MCILVRIFKIDILSYLPQSNLLARIVERPLPLAMPYSSHNHTVFDVVGGLMLLLLLLVVVLLLEVVSGAARVCWHGWQGLEHVLTPPPLPAAPHANSLVEMDMISAG